MVEYAPCFQTATRLTCSSPLAGCLYIWHFKADSDCLTAFILWVHYPIGFRTENPSFLKSSRSVRITLKSNDQCLYVGCMGHDFMLRKISHRPDNRCSIPPPVHLRPLHLRPLNCVSDAKSWSVQSFALSTTWYFVVGLTR